jgi:hypothetical protein
MALIDVVDMAFLLPGTAHHFVVRPPTFLDARALPCLRFYATGVINSLIGPMILRSYLRLILGNIEL